MRAFRTALEMPNGSKQVQQMRAFRTAFWNTKWEQTGAANESI